MQYVVQILIVVMVALGASGCGQSPPPIPVYPEAVPVQGENLVANALRDALLKEQQAQGLTATSQVYTIPRNHGFAEVQTFYTEALEAAGWQRDQMNIPVPDGGIAGWTRGERHAFVVMVLRDPLNNQTLLLTVEAQRE